MAKFRKMKITTDVVDQLAPGETVMDSLEPGFGVRRQGRARVFFLRKYANGRRHFVAIGECGTGDLTVTSARAAAKRWVVAVREGRSPSAERAHLKRLGTLSELVERWLSEHVEVKLKPSTARSYRSALDTIVLPAIGKLRVDVIDETHVARMHYGARATPYVANRALAIVSKVMHYAERRGLRPRGSNPVKGLERFKEHRRERFLSPEELARLGAALRDPSLAARHSPFAVAAIQLLLLTGMRRGEALSLKWREVHLSRGLLMLEDSKTGQKPVPIGGAAVQLLAGLPRTSSAYVFPGEKPGRPLEGVRRIWDAVREAAELPEIRIHDLRHTFASVAALEGASLPMIGKLLGHSQPATTARYAHLAHDPVKGVADRISNQIGSALWGNT
ncbi:MAG: tyrosine-type recombinase/integrase [Hyphomicrobiaceae bacterium]|nr:tyrosine-type recombinase/integrase [Hyphomicrobiaceae bacterium]